LNALGNAANDLAVFIADANFALSLLMRANIHLGALWIYALVDASLINLLRKLLYLGVAHLGRERGLAARRDDRDNHYHHQFHVKISLAYPR
jgi:hypothetical protein